VSVLSENPEIVISALAAMIRRAGGSVVITQEETRPFSIASKIEDGALHLMVMEYEPRASGVQQ
jgi:hypothetical protein